MLFPSFSAAHIQQRIHFLAIFDYLKMQVGAGGISRAANQRDGLAFRDPLPGGNQNFAGVAV